MDLNDVVKQAVLLDREQLVTLKSQIHEWLLKEQNEEEAANAKKLSAFSKAVRKAGILKELREVKVTKQVPLTVVLNWEYGSHLRDLDGPEDVLVHVSMKGRSDDVLDKLFKVSASGMKSKVYRAFKKVVALAKQYGVEDLDYDSAVMFLWEDS